MFQARLKLDNHQNIRESLTKREKEILTKTIFPLKELPRLRTRNRANSGRRGKSTLVKRAKDFKSKKTSTDFYKLQIQIAQVFYCLLTVI